MVRTLLTVVGRYLSPTLLLDFALLQGCAFYSTSVWPPGLGWALAPSNPSPEQEKEPCSLPHPRHLAQSCPILNFQWTLAEWIRDWHFVFVFCTKSCVNLLWHRMLITALEGGTHSFLLFLISLFTAKVSCFPFYGWEHWDPWCWGICPKSSSLCVCGSKYRNLAFIWLVPQH